jgi:predicted metal-dependent phosphoesterase TrpH
MKTRSAALLLLAAGLTTGSLADGSIARAALFSAEGKVLTADLHVHAFPGDGVLPAWELRKEARRRGIDVIAITNHNQSIASRLPAGGRPGELPIVIRGQEITSPQFHMVAAGVRRVVDWRLPLGQAIADVHSQGAVAIAAHPVRDSWRVRDGDALRGLDGTEAVHGRGEEYSRGRFQLREFYRTVRLHNPSAAAIGSSDFHGVAPLGNCRTYILVDEVSEQGVLNAIRRGRTVAADNRGMLIGDPGLVKVVQGAGASLPRPESDLARRLSVVMVLGALALLVCVK